MPETPHSEHLTALETNPQLLYEVATARLAGASLHDLPPAATTAFTRYGIYTAAAPRPPGKWRPFREHMRRQRAHDRISEDLVEAVESLYPDTFRQGRLGSEIKATFDAVTAIHGENVHIADHVYEDDKLVDGTVVVESMKFSVPDLNSSTILNDTLQAMLVPLNTTHLVRMLCEDDQHIVEVRNINEHTIRAIGRSVGALLAREDRDEGFELPPYKRRLWYWKKYKGETFPPEKETRLTTARDRFRLLRLTATYPGFRLRPRKNRGHLATDASHAFTGMRAIVNPLIRHAFQDGSARNKEQPKNKQDRIGIDRFVDLGRPIIDAKERQLGPPMSYSPDVFQKLSETGRLIMLDTKTHPVQSSVKVLAALAGAGMETLVELGLKITPVGFKAAREYLGDYKEWQKRKDQVEDNNHKLDNIWRSIAYNAIYGINPRKPLPPT